MDIISLLIFLAIGALVGWLAGFILKENGLGLLGNIIVGIIGSVMGGYLFSLLGITTEGYVGFIIMAVIGAVILLAIIRMIRKV
jgi:uncharacterized membrane protein YeaQ/YmgE (transglycosylase-associated protein family)